MKKQVVRITENDLHNIINESLRRIVAENEENEGAWDYAKSFWNQGKNKAMQAGQQVGAAIGQQAQRVGTAIGKQAQRAKGAMNNAYQGAKQGLQNMHQNALDASARGDMPKIVQQLQGIQQRVSRLMPNNRQASSAIQRVINLLNQASQQQ